MPTITFRLDMAPDIKSYPVPANLDTGTFASQVAIQRVSWLPNNLNNIRELKDQATFVLTGMEAVHLRQLVTLGAAPFVTIVSTSV